MIFYCWLTMVCVCLSVRPSDCLFGYCVVVHKADDDNDADDDDDERPSTTRSIYEIPIGIPASITFDFQHKCCSQSRFYLQHFFSIEYVKNLSFHSENFTTPMWHLHRLICWYILTYIVHNWLFFGPFCHFVLKQIENQ